MEANVIANDVFGSLGDTGPLAPKKVLKVSAELAGSVPLLGAFSSTFAEKYTLEKDVFFRSLARVPFFQISVALGRLWWGTLERFLRKY